MSFIEALDFEDVSSDTEFVNKASELNKWLLKINKHVQLAVEYKEKITNLTIEEKINYKIFMIYALNSLCWVQLRLKGIDPNTHPVKQQLQRIRQIMQKRDDIIDKRNRPTLNKDVANRFVRSGLWDPKNAPDREGEPVNKKIKFSNS